MMKKLVLGLLIATAIVVPTQNLKAQAFGTDVTVEANPSNQQPKAMDIALNGWIYVLNSMDTGGYNISRSTDGGNTFTVIGDVTTSTVYNHVDLIVAGSNTDTSQFSLFIAGYNPDNKVIYIDNYDRDGNFISSPYSKSIPNTTLGVRGLELATDYKSPGENGTVSPFSVVLATTERNGVNDSLRYFYSSSAGTSFVEVPVYGTSRFLERVSIAHGKSANYNNGRYFIAFEDFSASAAPSGHIGYTFTANDVTGGFLPVMWIDTVASVTGGQINNNVNNPRISFSSTTVDNDSSEFTGVVLFDRQFSVGDRDVLAFCNKRPMGTSITGWFRSDINNDGNVNCFDGDISYDPLFNNFLVTLYDSTHHDLNFTVKGFNLATPGNWSAFYIYNYCDNNANLVAPTPRVVMNNVTQKVGWAWTEKISGKLVTKFDAEWRGSAPNAVVENTMVNSLNVFPNPADAEVNIYFDLKQAGKVSFRLYDALGQQVSTIYDGQAGAGQNAVNLNVQNLASGMYLYTLQTDKGALSGKLTVKH